MLYFGTVTQLFHHRIVEIQSIISNDLLRNPITTKDILLGEACDHFLDDIDIRCCFDSLGEVVNSH